VVAISVVVVAVAISVVVVAISIGVRHQEKGGEGCVEFDASFHGSTSC
jgi:hypothetical protein